MEKQQKNITKMTNPKILSRIFLILGNIEQDKFEIFLEVLEQIWENYGEMS